MAIQKQRSVEASVDIPLIITIEQNVNQQASMRYITLQQHDGDYDENDEQRDYAVQRDSFAVVQ